MATPIWCLDTSSLICIRTVQLTREQQRTVYAGLSTLVEKGSLRFPREMVTELERYQGPDNTAFEWAKAHPNGILPTDYAAVASVLQEVPEVIDPDKEGTEEADPYVLAIAYASRLADIDARIVTEEFKTTTAKMNLGSAAGYLGIPSVSLRTMLKFEKILDWPQR